MQNNDKFAKEVACGVIDFLKKNKKSDLLGRVIELLQESLDSGITTVLTPRALTPQEKVKVKKFVNRVVGKDTKEIIFVKDETLLDGVRIETKDKVWDFSLSSQLMKFKEN